MQLVRPGRAHVESYVAALERGWSPDTLQPDAASQQRDAIATDPDAFLASLDDPDGAGPPVTLPDGTTAVRLPSLKRWIWQDGFCGTISLRWQPGTTALPPHCLGHIGYGVVPWRRGEGLASAALIDVLPAARAAGLAHVDITTDPENHASLRVIAKAGGLLVKTFEKPAALGGGPCRLFRIALD